MNFSNKKVVALLTLCALVLSILLGFAFNQNKEKTNIETAFQIVDTKDALFPQKVEKVLKEPVEITKLYNENQLVGIVSDASRLNALFDEVYVKEYKDEFPDSKLGFVQDIYQTKELSYNIYENKDEDIFDYIYDEDLLAIEVDKITFSNGAIIYVKSTEDFYKARREFFLSYVSEETYEKLINNETIPSPLGYTTVDKKLEVEETIVTSRGLASVEDILVNETEILNFLSFGYEPETKKYTVQEFDTIEGISWLNDLTPNQLVSINKEQISDSNQVLKPGLELNVTEFNSPLTVTISRERKVSEPIYPADIIYRNDPTLREGMRVVEVREQNGARDVVYEEVYKNDVIVSSVEKSSKTTKEPVRGVVRIGTYVEPRMGSGNFRWPMNNARISCGWYCYANHTAVDIQARNNRGYGPIYASDRGVVTFNGWYGTGGQTVMINHNNGYVTMYMHLASRGYFPVGATVRKGEQIGYVGMTGRTTGPHLHFEVKYNGRSINPCRVISC